MSRLFSQTSFHTFNEFSYIKGVGGNEGTFFMHHPYYEKCHVTYAEDFLTQNNGTTRLCWDSKFKRLIVNDIVYVDKDVILADPFPINHINALDMIREMFSSKTFLKPEKLEPSPELLQQLNDIKTQPHSNKQYCQREYVFDGPCTGEVCPGTKYCKDHQVKTPEPTSALCTKKGCGKPQHPGSQFCKKHTTFCSFKWKKEKCRDFPYSGSLLCKKHQDFCIHNVNDPRIIKTGDEINCIIIFDGPVWLGKTPEGKALSKLSKDIQIAPKMVHSFRNGTHNLVQSHGGQKQVTHKGPVYSDRTFHG